MRILLTGGCGFIGSAVARFLIGHTPHEVLNIDVLEYAASLDAVAEVSGKARYLFSPVSILDASALQESFSFFQPDAVMHFAAQTHVDRSIDDPRPFLQTNVMGTFTLLEAARKYWSRLEGEKREKFLFHHISTDEVFGSLKADDPPFSAQSRYRPASPYAASKAASDHLVRAWRTTYGLPTFVSNTTNNFGPWQFPEKLIPTVILNAFEEKFIPLYGDGQQKRDWIFVEDHAEGLVRAIERGRAGQTYLLGARECRANEEIVLRLCRILDEMRPLPDGRRHEGLITRVKDRPGHDFRYEIDPGQTEWDLSWKAQTGLDEGLRKTVAFYLDHEDWWRDIRANRYGGQRLGQLS